MIRVAVIASTGGAVYKAVARTSFVRDRIAVVISDRDCGAIDAARDYGHRSAILPYHGGVAFSDAVLDLLEGADIGLAVSFYTRLFRGRLLESYCGRLVNFHPSILPAAPGVDGFGDTIRAGSRFIGSTVHLVDEGVDTGRPLLQAACPNNPALSLTQRRHRIFQQQCQSLIQTIAWFENGRVQVVGGEVAISDACYAMSEFSPNLDCPEAIAFDAGMA
jgi:phosphoribosylglycinamide formyltransferase-1